MEVSHITNLLNSISRFDSIFSGIALKSKLVRGYCHEINEMLKFLEPLVNDIISSGTDLNENLNESFEELVTLITTAVEHMESWHQMTSKVYFVLQIETLIANIQKYVLDICSLLHSHPPTSSSKPAEQCMEEVQSRCHKEAFAVINKLITETDQQTKNLPSRECLAKLEKSLSLETNEEILMELVSLYNLKTETDRGENKVEYVERMIEVISHMHDLYVEGHQVRAINNITIPLEYCCPISLQLMSDPVIVSSGQTYDRIFIQKWFDQGFSVCPKTRESLDKTRLITNHLAKALIAKWCEKTNIKLPNTTATGSTNSKHFSRNGKNLELPYSKGYRASTSAASFDSSQSIDIPESSSRVPLQFKTSISSSIMISPLSGSSNGYKHDQVCIDNQIHKLIEEMQSDSVDMKRRAAGELWFLSKDMENVVIISNFGAIPSLVELLLSPDMQTQEKSVTSLLNLSLSDINKTEIAQAGAIPPLVHVLKTGNPIARANSAATLRSLSVITENNIKIGQSGAIDQLVELLCNGNVQGKKDATRALYSLSLLNENRVKIVEAGAVKHLLGLMNPAFGMANKVLCVLTNIAKTREGRSAIGEEGGIPVLVEMVELGSDKEKEIAASALLDLCISRNRFRRMVFKEGVKPPLMALTWSGTPRAKEKARKLLDLFKVQ